VISDNGEISVEKWQRKWDKITKRKISKEYFPGVAVRLNMKINVTHNVTSVVTGHGNKGLYMHRFKNSKHPLVRVAPSIKL